MSLQYVGWAETTPAAVYGGYGMNRRFSILAPVLAVVLLWCGTAALAAESYEVVLRAEPENGGSVTGGGEYAQGRNAVFTAVPNEGYTFVGWFREDEATPFSTEMEYEYDLEASRTYIARFDKALTVGVIAEPAEAGRVTQSGDGNYVADQSVTLTADSNPGYSFIGWFDVSSPANPVSTDTSFAFNVSQPVSFIARFAALYRLDINISPDGSGTAEGAGEYAGGRIVMLEADPAKDYRVVGWASPAAPDKMVSGEEKYTFNLDTDLTLTAYFARSYQYIGARVALFAAIGAGAAIGLIVLSRHMRMVRRKGKRTEKAPHTTIYRKDEHKKTNKK
jgi:hypothetical protein